MSFDPNPNQTACCPKESRPPTQTKLLVVQRNRGPTAMTTTTGLVLRQQRPGVNGVFPKLQVTMAACRKRNPEKAGEERNPWRRGRSSPCYNRRCCLKPTQTDLNQSKPILLLNQTKPNLYIFHTITNQTKPLQKRNRTIETS